MKAYLASHLSSLIEDPAIVDAIKGQNAKTATYSQAKIDALDKAWQAEVGLSQMPMVTPVLKNAASAFLRKQVKASGGEILEAFVMDNKRLNVAVSSPTSDHWQGDQAKWQKTYLKSVGAVNVGKVDFDVFTRPYEAQISTTVTDPATG